MSATETPLLSVQGLTVSFGSRTVVHNLSFDVSAGRTLAVVGESGSGKSVTSLAIMRLLPAHISRVSGRIMFEGRNLLELPERQMRQIRGGKISMIFQEPMTSLNPVQRVGDQLAEAIRYHRGLSGAALEKAVLDLFDMVRIPDARRRVRQYPHMFSGGMRQRVMIAMALACNPSLIIADEPTTALDVTVQAQILSLMRDLQRETGTAFLFITHDMGVVAEIADDVLVMRHGRMVEKGNVHDVFTTPREEYTRTLIAAVPSMVGSLAAQRIEPKPIETLPPDKTGILSVDNLSVRFPVSGGLFRKAGAVHAVENVSLSINQGETLGLVGESGSGKSTIGKAIINLVPLHSGMVRVNGETVDYNSSASLMRLRRNVQMIFQDPFGSLDSRQSIGSAIMEPMLVHGLAKGAEAKERMEWLLERVGLDPLRASSLPHEFSGGQRQRICIARALAMSPKVIIADEAVSALDVSIKAQIIDLMIDLQEDLGISYLFISHDMAAVEKICHRVAVMYFGEIVEIGNKEDVIGRPIHPYTQHLLSAIPVNHPKLRGTRPPLADMKPRSALRPPGYEPPPARWMMAADGHFVRQPD